MPCCRPSRLLLAFGLMLSMLGSVHAQPLVAPTEALSPAEQQKLFHLPPGFEIQLVAAEPEIAKPMNITFDSQGRLWVTDTLEYPYPAKGDAVPRDCVKILVDKDGDGRAEQISTFVDKLNIPLGVMPIPGGVICYGIPQVMRCMDTDGDGKADMRDPLYLNFGSRDTHGMVNSFTRGLDGWLYACHGFNNDSSPEGADGQKISMNSGNTFRMKPDGSHVEYFTHGQVNPFGLAFDPLGNLYSADCHTLPCYNLLRGAYYPSFGKAHDGLDFGPTMINHNHGSTGIGGIAYYSASQFPPEYRDTILIGNPVTGRVNHDKLEKHGSSYNCVELPDFISCDDQWFRPVNLQIGPDGALYIADFYNCIIGHYEVPLEHPRRDRTRGRIWRVVYTGQGVDQPPKTAPAKTPNIHAASLDELLALLGHDNLTVRTFATHELVDRIGPPAIEPLKQLIGSEKASPDVKVHGLWALERLAPIESALLGQLLHDPDRLVRVHALKLLAERKVDDLPQAREALADSEPFVRRAAADALGRHPQLQNVRPLLEVWAQTPAEDTHLIHVVRMALRDQLLKPGLFAELAEVIPADDQAMVDRLANVCLGVKNEETAAFIAGQLAKDKLTDQRDSYLHYAIRYLAQDKLEAVYRGMLQWQSLPAMQQLGVLRAVGQASQERGQTWPAEYTAWTRSLAEKLLSDNAERRQRAGIELARDFRPDVFVLLAKAAGSGAQHGGLRPAAMDACAAYPAGQAMTVLAAVLTNQDEPLNLRQHAAGALARVNDDAARAQLLTSLQTAPKGWPWPSRPRWRTASREPTNCSKRWPPARPAPPAARDECCQSATGKAAGKLRRTLEYTDGRLAASRSADQRVDRQTPREAGVDHGRRGARRGLVRKTLFALPSHRR